MIVSLYKDNSHAFNYVVSKWKRGPYSHSELIFSNGMSGSSSFREDGVRVKRVVYDPLKWDFIVLDNNYSEEFATKWFEDHKDDKYDLLGIAGFVISPVAEDKGKQFCSETVMLALAYPEGWRVDPNLLPIVFNKTPIDGLLFDYEKYNVPKKL